MHYAIVDLEWNQYHNPMWTPTSRQGVIMHEEIIQIGAVKTDEEMTPVDSFNLYVRLGGRRRLDRYVKKLTGINESDIASGEDFPIAAQEFISWIKDVDAVFSWGPDDRRVFLNNLAFHGLNPPKCAWYDAQKIYAAQHPEHGPLALKHTAEEAGVRVNLTLHDAMNDAALTAMCLKTVDMQKGISQLEAPQATPANGMPRPLSSARTHRHPSPREAWEEACASLMNCPKCMSPLTWEEGEKGSIDRWYKLASCVSHGRFLVRGEFMGIKFKTLKLSFFEATPEAVAMADRELAPAVARKRSRRRKKKPADTVPMLTGEELFAKALTFAQAHHAGQTLEPGQAPYITHLMEVCQIASTLTDDYTLLSAALLHDTLAKCPEVSADILRSEFNDHVAELVESTSSSDDEECLILRLSDALSGLRALSYTRERLGNAFVGSIGSETLKAAKDGYKQLIKACKPLEKTSAYKEAKRLSVSVFAGLKL
ncbi:MAG: HD domain-containing protein [Clostridiales bacterium]|nr:HD domain-containing protein [Clostridiales bacterium]